MRTVGVDLAAGAERTAVATIDWAGGGAELTALRLGATDADVVEAARTADAVGIDCAFGWPDEFVAFVAAHADGDAPDGPIGDLDWRRRLAYRETDRRTRALTGRWPLSVSTDRLGLTAMRCAGLLQALEATGIPVQRDASGSVFEVYPGASLRLWGVPTAGYRTDAAQRERMLLALTAATPWLSWSGREQELVASADALDAVVAALATRSAARGLFHAPADDERPRARREGWIALPTGALADLADD